MAIKINSTENSPLKIAGLSYQPTSVYARLRWVANDNGKTAEVEVKCYETKENYLKGEMIPVLFKVGDQVGALSVVNVTLGETEEQTNETIHRHVAEAFIKNGYETEIEL